MKKILSIVTLMTLCLTASFKASAIEDPSPVGTTTVGVMAGIDPLYYTSVGIGGLVFYDSVVANLWMGHITVGGQLGYEFFSASKVSAFSVAPRATYGVNITESIEVHGGLSVGYYNFGSVLRGMHHAEFVGMNYYVTPSLSLSAQLGYSLCSPALCVGVAFQF